MNKIMILMFCLFNFVVLSQESRYSNKYLDSLIDSSLLVKKNYRNKSIKEISEYLTINEVNQKLQYSVLAKWIVNHLNYDKHFQNSTIQNSINSKKGVCYHYSILMDSLAKYHNINSYDIGGYVKEISNGKLKFIKHAWNAAEIDGNIYMSDITWSDGENKKNSKNASLLQTYFLVNPETFILSHFPSKKRLRFTKYSYNEFRKTPVINSGYYIIDKYFYNNLKELKLHNNQREINISLKEKNEFIKIVNIELIGCAGSFIECDNIINFVKKTNLEINKTTFQLDSTYVNFSKNQPVSIIVEYKDIRTAETGYASIVEFFW